MPSGESVSSSGGIASRDGQRTANIAKAFSWLFPVTVGSELSLPRPATDSPRSPSKRDKSARRRRARSARAARHRPPQSLRTDLMLKHSSMLDRAPSARQVHRGARLRTAHGWTCAHGVRLSLSCVHNAVRNSNKPTHPALPSAQAQRGAYALTPRTRSHGPWRQ